MTRTLRSFARPFRRDRHSIRRPAWRPEPVAALEGRALLAASPVVPTFNGGQPVVTPFADSATTTSQPTAAAVQGDGKIVVVGYADPAQPVGSSFSQITAVYVTRFNTDGTLDTTFGTGGRLAVPLPGTSTTTLTVAHDVLIQPNGRIILNVNEIGGFVGIGSIVTRLTASGALDSSFGTNGQVDLTGNNVAYSQLALQTDGKIILAGTSAISTTGDITNSSPTTTVTRIDSTGTVDPTFNGGTPALLGASFGSDYTGAGVLDVAVVNGGVRVVASGPTSASYVVSQLTGTGVLDSSFGSGGTVSSNTVLAAQATAALILPTGQVLIGATVYGPISGQLVQLNADGSRDIFFRPSLDVPITTLASGANSTVYVGGGSNFTPLLSVVRLLPDGSRDLAFGPGGVARLSAPTPPAVLKPTLITAANVAAVVPTTNGQVAVVGSERYIIPPFGTYPQNGDYGAQAVIGLLGATNRLAGMNNDYDGDNISDLAAELTQYGAFAYRPSTGTGTGDVVQPFGAPGAGLTIPAPGDYDGDGKADVAAYLPNLGVVVARPSSGGPDVAVRFGPTGVGAAIPVPGDYDGDGRTDVALFLPASATFIFAPSGGAQPYQVQFGAAGAGNSIPVVGDFDGSGRTELGVYLPGSGQFIFRSNITGQDVSRTFGPAGVGASIPFAGDYNGDGLSDLALFLPGSSTFAILRSNLTSTSQGVALSGATTAGAFGIAGTGQSIPVPGDFDGDGRTDYAVLLTSSAVFARSSSAFFMNSSQQFGVPGAGNTVPASPAVQLLARGVSAMSLRSTAAADPNAGLVFFLPDDAPGRKKPTT